MKLHSEMLVQTSSAAAYSADTVNNKGIAGIAHPRYQALMKLQISGKISFKVALKSKLFSKHLEF